MDDQRLKNWVGLSIKTRITQQKGECSPQKDSIGVLSGRMAVIPVGAILRQGELVGERLATLVGSSHY